MLLYAPLSTGARYTQPMNLWVNALLTWIHEKLKWQESSSQDAARKVLSGIRTFNDLVSDSIEVMCEWVFVSNNLW